MTTSSPSLPMRLPLATGVTVLLLALLLSPLPLIVAQALECPLTCPNRLSLCFQTCGKDAGKRGRFKVPAGKGLTCPPGTTKPTTKQPWCYTKPGGVTEIECCAACTKAGPKLCTYWHHFVATSKNNPQLRGICWLYPFGHHPRCMDNPQKGHSVIRNNNEMEFNCSQVGRNCADGTDDPHFHGADGTRFDFNGLPGQSFCLLTDRGYHINMKMEGYLDKRDFGASVYHDGKVVRTWIRELGIMYKGQGEGEGGEEHKLHLVARKGKQKDRGDGYLAAAELDGHAIAFKNMTPGDSLALPGGLTLTYVGLAYRNKWVMDHYRVTLPGQFALDMQLRLGLRILQTPKDAEVHFNLAFADVSDSETLHGVMGQTYRPGRDAKTLNYKALNALMHHSVAADGDSGAGYLDGTVGDYMTTDVLSTDCHFTAYTTGSLPM